MGRDRIVTVELGHDGLGELFPELDSHWSKLLMFQMGIVKLRLELAV